jgi:hypothetical protein
MVGTALAVNHQPAAQAGPGSIPVNKMLLYVLGNFDNLDFRKMAIRHFFSALRKKSAHERPLTRNVNSC